MTSINTNNKVRKKTFCDELCYFSLCRCFKKEAKNETAVELTFDDDYSEISLFDFNGYEAQVRIVDVYDGDTVKIVFPLTDNEPERLYRWNCRLINIDTPEIRTKNQKEIHEINKDVVRQHTPLVHAT